MAMACAYYGGQKSYKKNQKICKKGIDNVGRWVYNKGVPMRERGGKQQGRALDECPHEP